MNLYNDHMKVSRRSLGKILVAAAPAAVLAQTPQPPSPNDDAKSAHDAMRNNLSLIAKVKIPMAVEPAFRFKA